jgi:uncharacterized protein YggU (UPF0235/DUF167 family)
MLDALAADETGVVVPVRAQPGAHREGLLGARGGALRIATTAPPEDGRATQRIGEVLAEALGLPRSAVSCVGGATRRDKRYLARGLSLGVARQRLAAALAQT